MRNRQGNNPKRKVMEKASLSDVDKDRLVANTSYVGSGNHKRSPSDYGFVRVYPTPDKTHCEQGPNVRIQLANKLLADGIKKSMISKMEPDTFPKYIWSVFEGTAFEAKTDISNKLGEYHGYPLLDDGADRDFAAYIRAEWSKR